jgi:3-phenylpropionate/trans-cinnamate dioxygenase ferredoxin reductase subunit
MSDQQRVVVVGASLAGAHTALRLRDQGHEGPLTLIGAEPHLPYERPGLSKGYLTGELPVDALLVRPQAAYDDAGITLRLGTRATGLDTTRGRVLLDGEDLPYDALVVATGSANVRPPIPGMDLDGVFQLRTIDDADRLRAAAATASRAVVVGMGFIGCEIAATLSGLGVEVTAVDALPGPMWAVLGERLSALVATWHGDNGVTLLGGVGVAAIEGGHAAERVRLKDGTVLDADLVVVGVGARPALEWLGEAPLPRAAGGLAVDAGLRSELPQVLAVGDVAAVWDATAGEHRRTEHYSSAIAQAAVAAASVLGLPPPAAKPSTFFTEQYGHYLQYAGRHTDSDVLVERPVPYAGFFLREGVLTAVATVDNGKDLRRSLPLLGRPVDPAALADPAVDLRTLA